MPKKGKTPAKTKRIPRELTEVTVISKALAVFLFLTLPFIGFFAGTQYQSTIDINNQLYYSPPILIYPTPTPIQYPTPPFGCHYGNSCQGNSMSPCKMVLVCPGQ